MAVPGFRYFLRPVLELVADKKEVSNARNSLIIPVKEKMRLTEQDAAERLDSGGNRIANRVGWALTYLTKAGLVEFPKRGYVRITAEGIKFLATHSGDIQWSDLNEYAGYREFTNASTADDSRDSSDNVVLDEIDPEEKISIGFREIKNDVIDELKVKLHGMNPTQFEGLVLNLIRALGYGGSTEKLEHTGGSGDFGVDGIVHLDRLGLDKIYLQAKRYKPENKINSRQIQEFFGALKGRHATKGIFITTSSYQDSAIEYAKSVSDTLVLLDGTRVAELMIDAQVGVTAKRTIIIPSIDNDFFEE
jgi:restriction system protein